MFNQFSNNCTNQSSIASVQVVYAFVHTHVVKLKKVWMFQKMNDNN